MFESRKLSRDDLGREIGPRQDRTTQQTKIGALKSPVNKWPYGIVLQRFGLLARNLSRDEEGDWA